MCVRRGVGGVGGGGGALTLWVLQSIGAARRRRACRCRAVARWQTVRECAALKSQSVNESARVVIFNARAIYHHAAAAEKGAKLNNSLPKPTENHLKSQSNRNYFNLRVQLVAKLLKIHVGYQCGNLGMWANVSWVPAGWWCERVFVISGQLREVPQEPALRAGEQTAGEESARVWSTRGYSHVYYQKMRHRTILFRCKAPFYNDLNTHALLFFRFLTQRENNYKRFFTRVKYRFSCLYFLGAA